MPFCLGNSVCANVYTGKKENSIKIRIKKLQCSGFYRGLGLAVEVVVVDSEGYRILDRGEVTKQLDRLKPLED